MTEEVKTEEVNQPTPVELTDDEKAAKVRADYLAENPEHVGLAGDLDHPGHPEHGASDDRRAFLDRLPGAPKDKPKVS